MHDKKIHTGINLYILYIYRYLLKNIDDIVRFVPVIRAILPLSLWTKNPSDRRLRFTPYRLDSVLYRCAVKHLWDERTYLAVRSMKQQNRAEVELFRTSFWNCRPLHKLGTDVRTLLDLDLDGGPCGIAFALSCWEGSHIRAQRAADT